MSDEQKYLGIRRSDSYLCTINDSKFPFYKNPKTSYVDSDIYNRPTYNGDKDFVIGYNPNDNTKLYSPSTE